MKTLLLASLAFLLIGCSSPVTLKGEVFAGTVGGDSVKFGAAPVYIFKKENVAKLEPLFGNVDKADFTANTDADGKFSLQVPKGDYVIAVKTSRRINEQTELYRWIYPVSVTADTNVSLNHTNISEL